MLSRSSAGKLACSRSCDKTQTSAAVSGLPSGSGSGSDSTAKTSHSQSSKKCSCANVNSAG